MDNMGFLNLSLLDVEEQQAADPSTRVNVVRLDGVVIHQFSNLQFPPIQQLPITAFPQASNLHGEVFPTRYRPSRINFFTLNHEEIRPQQVRVVRDPKKWQSEFIRWNELPAHFEPLKKVLSASTTQVIGGESLGRFVEETYDRAENPKTVLAKATLLNLFAKLTMVPEPIGGRTPWFNFIERILMIDRERIYAVVDQEMGEVVRRILDNIGRFIHYRIADSTLHTKKLRDHLPGYDISGAKIVSVKTDERHANLQLTLAPARDPEGQSVLLLDADIDEDGDLLNHLIDVLLVHPATGGTHPFDIHEYLLREDRHLQLGYRLV